MKSLNQKIKSNKTNNLFAENELIKLHTFDWINFRGKSHFEEGGTQSCLVFQPMYRYFKRVAGVGSGDYIHFLKSKGLSDENITAPTKYKYSGYSVGFDRHGFFSNSSTVTRRNVVIFGIDMISSTKTNKRKKEIFIPGKSFLQGL